MLASSTRSSGWPRMRGSSASRYTVRSGSSGMRPPKNSGADLAVVEAGGGVEARDPVGALELPLEELGARAGGGELCGGGVPPGRGAAGERLEHEHAAAALERAREADEQPLSQCRRALVQHEARGHEIPRAEARHARRQRDAARPPLHTERLEAVTGLTERPARAIEREHALRAAGKGERRAHRAGARAEIDHLRDVRAPCRRQRCGCREGGEEMERRIVAGECRTEARARERRARDAVRAAPLDVARGERANAAPDLPERERLAS